MYGIHCAKHKQGYDDLPREFIMVLMRFAGAWD